MSVRIDGTSGSGGVTVIQPATPGALIVFGDNSQIEATKTVVDSVGSLYENTGVFTTGTPNNPFTNVSHPRVFFQTNSVTELPPSSLLTTVTLCNVDLPNNFFVQGQSVRIRMAGNIGSGTDPFTYSIRAYLCTNTSFALTIEGPANYTGIYRYEAIFTFTQDIFLLCNSSATLYNSAVPGETVSFGAIAQDEYAQDSDSIARVSIRNTNTANADNVFTCRQCEFSYT